MTTPIEGYALAVFAFDIGFAVDLDGAAPLVRRAQRAMAVRTRRPAPLWFDYHPAPIRLAVEGEPVKVGDVETAPTAEILIYDFGAVQVTYRLPLPASLDGARRLSGELYEHEALEADARRRAGEVLALITPAVERPRLSEAFEDYAVFAITSWGDEDPRAVLEAHRARIAGMIEAEESELSAEQIERSTAGVMSYSTGDLAVVDWNAAVLFDSQPEDVIAVLQHANIELLEFRILDLELDAILDHADETLAALMRRRVWPGFASSRMLGRFASVQTDAAVMFEGVNNAIKLLGNQYLARLYRMSASQLDLPAWQESVQRKLDAAESLYQKMSDAASIKRLETLEWVIIALITISILLPFMPWYSY